MKNLIRKSIQNKKITFILIKILEKIRILLFYLFRVFSLENKVIVTNFNGKGFGDNGKYILDQLLKSENSKKIKMVWVVSSNKEFVPSYIKKIKINSLKYIYEMSTARVWIDNCRQNSYIKKRKGQFYIQTWHGAPALKRIEKDVEDKLPKEYIINAKMDSQKIDLILSNCKWMTDLYKKAFWYDGKILECGSPRNDIFFIEKDNVLDKIKKYYKLQEKKIILYAPTFRKEKNKDYYNLKFDMILETLKIKFNEEFVFMIKLHPGLVDDFSKNFDKQQMVDASGYPDVQELLSAADILITDYSSLMFDFSITKKPCFLFCNDIQEYTKDRNFYFEMSDLPFSVSETNEELVEEIKRFEHLKYINKIGEFHKKIGYLETGKASMEVAKIIQAKMKDTTGFLEGDLK